MHSHAVQSALGTAPSAHVNVHETHSDPVQFGASAGHSQAQVVVFTIIPPVQSDAVKPHVAQSLPVQGVGQVHEQVFKFNVPSFWHVKPHVAQLSPVHGSLHSQTVQSASGLPCVSVPQSKEHSLHVEPVQ